MIVGLVSGSLFHSPEQRTSKNDKPYVKATIKVHAGAESLWINVVAFSNTAKTELLLLVEGDELSVQWPLTANIYTAADGIAKVSLTIVASHVLALRQPPKERKPKAAAPDEPRSRAGSWTGPADGPDDEVPF